MPHSFYIELSKAAEQLAQLLQQSKQRIVFAESCTAGLVSATLAQVPGISQWYCGSAVVYRETTKTAWLKIPPEFIETNGVVSAEVAARMAKAVLEQTPDADISAAITGHLGPDAPAHLDGVVYIATAKRNDVASRTRRVTLTSQDRQFRQPEAAAYLLDDVSNHILPTRNT